MSRAAPVAQADSPFLVDPDAGELDTLYANSGVVSRRNPAEPGASSLPALLRKVTHFRAPGLGDAMWSGQCVYDLQGVTPSYSEYDQPDPYGVVGDNLDYRITAGVVTTKALRDADEPTMSRESRVSAHYDSAPAAAIFQGYFNPRWSGLLSGFRPNIQPRPLHSNFNPGQMGSKELHKATQYKPVPPLGSLVGYFGSSEKAL